MKNLNIKLSSFRHILILSFVVFTCSTSFAQLNKLTQQIDSSTTFYEINIQEKVFLDSLKLVLDSASYYSGGSEFREYKRFKTFWEPRLFPDITFERYMLAEQAYFGTTKSNYAYLSNENWWEIGPKVPPTTANTGVGPAEFITFFDNGTPASTQHMLSGSLPGGLFYSQDAGETWTPAGSDSWDNSGCSWAVFHPTNNQIWCASTSGNSATGQSSWIGYRGGIHLTTNAGQTWNLIADYNDLGGNWTIIQKIQFHPTNGNILYVATSNGLYKTENLFDQNIIWSKIIDNYAVYDFEFKPNNPNIIYATYRYEVWDRNQIVPWSIKKSINGGLTWSDMDTLNTTYLTIEVSKAQPDYLYACILTGNQATIRFFDGSTWSIVTPINYIMDFGHGHAFGVEQVQSGEQIITSRNTRIQHLYTSYSINPTIPFTTYYVDVEDVVFHPYNLNEVWLATHGGPEKSTDGGLSWTPKYNGFAAAMISKMATSFTNPELIMLGLYHQGTVISRTNYSNNWNPAWQNILAFWDGQQPLIDNINPNNVWASHQGRNGNWTTFRYNNNFFQGGNTTIPSRPIWQTLGVLNKNNSNFLYVNSCPTANVLQEEVLRFNSRGSTTGEYITEFRNILQYYPDEIWMLGMVTPYYSDDHLIIWFRAKNTINKIESFHVFITNNATSQVPIWNELAIPRQGWITDIRFDPSNTDIVYLCYGSSFPDDIFPYSNQFIYKIDYSNFSNPVFSDITKNLPYTFTGPYCIETERGSDGRIYLSTDFGVFVTDNQLLANDTWLRMGEGYPNCRAANGIEINYIKDLLRVGTEGRGIWEIPLPCDFSNNSIIINQNTTWDSFERINRNIIVKDGATLTIGTNARISFSENSKIIIEQGAKLIVDGGRLTSACNGMWQGIEVWGNSDASQFPINGVYSQGIVELINGAVIENAMDGIRNHNPEDQDSRGGIIRCDGAVFKNNRRAVEFLEYRNFHPNNPSVRVSDLSYFKNSTFTVDDDYIGSNEFFAHVSMCNVQGNVGYTRCAKRYVYV